MQKKKVRESLSLGQRISRNEMNGLLALSTLEQRLSMRISLRSTVTFLFLSEGTQRKKVTTILSIINIT